MEQARTRTPGAEALFLDRKGDGNRTNTCTNMCAMHSTQTQPVFGKLASNEAFLQAKTVGPPPALALPVSAGRLRQNPSPCQRRSPATKSGGSASKRTATAKLDEIPTARLGEPSLAYLRGLESGNHPSPSSPNVPSASDFEPATRIVPLGQTSSSKIPILL